MEKEFVNCYMNTEAEDTAHAHVHGPGGVPDWTNTSARPAKLQPARGPLQVAEEL